MVRRWSRINNLNKKPHENVFFYPVKEVLTVINLKHTRYAKTLPSGYTMFIRRRWSRRKHLNKWVNYTYFLIKWAFEYKFYKKHNNWLHTLGIFQPMFTFFNFLHVKNLNIVQQQQLNSFLFTSSHVNYKNSSNRFLPFLQKSSLLFSTLTSRTFQNDNLKNSEISQLLKSTFAENKFFIYPTDFKKYFTLISSLRSVILSVITEKVKLLYKVSIIITVNRLF
jgi:hypothetical protein